MKHLLLATTLIFAASQVAAKTVNWIDWTSSTNDSSGFSAFGTITSGTETIDVTYNNPQGVAFIQTGTGLNYFTGSPSPYTSTGPNGNDNAPPGAEMIALRFAGTQSLTFSKPVENLYYSFVSMNGNGYGFSQDFEILSFTGGNVDGAGTDGRGFWGSGGVERVENIDGTFSLNATGGEPHGTIFFDDVFSVLTWDSLTSENWNGFTIGVEGTQDQVSGVVPLPAGGVLLLSALGLLGWRARKT